MSNSKISVPVSSTDRSAWRSIGVWMTAILIGYILFNTFRSVSNPTAFAEYYGLPLGDPDNTAFVFVYAIRSLFLGLFGLALLVRRAYPVLALYTLIGSVMPVGDAILVAMQGGGTATVIRHILTAGFLLLTWFFMRRWANANAAN